MPDALQLQVLLYKHLVDFIQDNIHAVTIQQSQIPVTLLGLSKFSEDTGEEAQADLMLRLKRAGGPLHTRH